MHKIDLPIYYAIIQKYSYCHPHPNNKVLKMKKTIKILLFATISSIAFSASAKDVIIKLEDNSRLLGKWRLYKETAALHKKAKEVQNDWNFGTDGVLTSTSRDPRLGASKDVKVKYSIEDGVIKKQMQPGREKYETCAVVKLDGKDMTLHCKYNYYLFTKK